MLHIYLARENTFLDNEAFVYCTKYAVSILTISTRRINVVPYSRILTKSGPSACHSAAAAEKAVARIWRRVGRRLIFLAL